MAKFLLAYKGTGMPETEAAREAETAAWGGWFGALGAAVVEPGNPFGASATVRADGAQDGAGASGLTGYSVLAADSLATANDLAKGCPVLRSGGAVEVYEIFEIM